MTISSAQDILMKRLPMFARVGKSAVKKGLKNILALCEALDHPQKKFKSIHVAGTNGKGSTCHILAATFQQAGYKTGLYTSPHLVDIRERVKINGELMSEDAFVDFVKLVEPLIETIQPSYFELNVAMAFYHFASQKVDIAIIETGLGGKWDSTNIIIPELSVITSIALDHTDVLGDTLDKIAKEKAGIIKENIPVVIGKTQFETEPIFVQDALLKKSPILFADTLFSLAKLNDTKQTNTEYYKAIDYTNKIVYNIQTDLKGNFQSSNIITAWGAIKMMEQLGWKVNDNLFFEALKNVKKVTNFRGRWDNYQDNIILDVAHNPDGILQIIENLSAEQRRLKIVYGSVKDKDVAGSVNLLPKNAKYYLTQAQVPRAKPVNELRGIFEENGFLKLATFESVNEAMKQAVEELEENDLLLIIGSFFIVGEAYSYLDEYK